MKILISITIIALNFCIAHGQKYSSKTLSYENCKEFIFNVKNKDSTVYNINATELRELIKCKEKKYTLIYVFSTSCVSVREEMKEVAKLLKNKNTDIMFTSIDGDGSKWLYYFYNYFLKVHYTFPLFLISDTYSKRGEKRLKLFLKELEPTRDYKKVGAGSLILFDMNGDLLYCSDYTYEHPVEDVKRMITNE